MGIKLPVKETIEIEEGKHTGRISRLEERKEPYHYIDVWFELDSGVEIKHGYPATVSERTALGKLLDRMGATLEVGSMVDLEEALVGRRVWLMTINEKTEDGVFARVVKGSVRPV